MMPREHSIDSISDDRSSSKSSSAYGPNLVRKQSKVAVEEVKNDVAVKEQFRVLLSKTAMILILVGLGTIFCMGTYILAQQQGIKDLKKEVGYYADSILLVSQEKFLSTYDAIAATGETATSTAIDTNRIWPKVSIPHYPSKTLRTSKLISGAQSSAFAVVVQEDERESFEEYANTWTEALLQESLDYSDHDSLNSSAAFDIPTTISSFVGNTSNTTPDPQGSGPYTVVLQQYPVLSESTLLPMTNILNDPLLRRLVMTANETKSTTAMFSGEVDGKAELFVVQPVFQDVLPPDEDVESLEMMGVTWFVVDFVTYFNDVFPTDILGVTLVVRSDCGYSLSFIVDGPEVDFLGFYDAKLDVKSNWTVSVDFVELNNGASSCDDILTLHLYPSSKMENEFISNKPATYAALTGIIFVITWVAFSFYDRAVQLRQQKVMDRVKAQDRIVSGLFPSSVKDQLFTDDKNGGTETDLQRSVHGQRRTSDAFATNRQIANLFLETTVLFADIAGFTAWSSAREPTQVFVLLETLYGAFDALTHRHSIYKVETIGDCYMAVTGLPEPNEYHALCMAKFARACMEKFVILTKKLEIGLGPDTAELALRVGMHSGQVTAGVLRGERSRFQLFGDTVNTASRMESSGEPGRIQVSGITAKLIEDSGRSKWIRPRGEIQVAGKGVMHTCWLETKEETEERHLQVQREMCYPNKNENVADDGSVSSDGDDEDEKDIQAAAELSKKARLVEWNTKLLSGLLKSVIAAQSKRPRNLAKAEASISADGKTVLEDFQEVIELPKVTMAMLRDRRDRDAVVIEPKVLAQLRSFIARIADMYNPNAFHNFEHASHVTASVAKLLSRIVTSDTTHQTTGANDMDTIDLAGHSYGITSDPLTQFTVVLSAVLHDVDHQGIPNAQLIKEDVAIATKYKGKSVAEQNSVDIAWTMLMEPQYAALRACIYADEVELRRFRQILVNVVMATDIADKELGALRKERWNRAFEPDVVVGADDSTDRKATIVLEHLIQASDVSHTMQHWQVYRKWNEKLFFECYDAWKAGLADQDPSLGWYKGELGFFDFYVIPLTKKLGNCGVFGVSSHEYLNYAMANRNEWEKKGKQMVEDDCGYALSFIVDGPEVDFLGFYDVKEDVTSNWTVSVDFVELNNGSPLCNDSLTLHLYASEKMENKYIANKPAVYAALTGIIFFITWIAFSFYDRAVQTRQQKVMDRVKAQDRIVSGLFPSSVKDQLFKESGNGNTVTDPHAGGFYVPEASDAFSTRQQIANLFLETTVLFADIAGFTAWSSAREPSQVFVLLETLYGAFDALTHRHAIYKVETIGDCYMAVSGLPVERNLTTSWCLDLPTEPNEHHALSMAKFARACMEKFVILTKKLEIGLGPDTAELALRVGMHSGQVTAGVLRGERSRFQLFGDTVNTASRMESSGEPGRIQVSGITAKLIEDSGRSKWIRPRGEIQVAGKGVMHTCWLETKEETEERHLQVQREMCYPNKNENVADDGSVSSDGDDEDEKDIQAAAELSKKARLVEWNTKLLSGLLKSVIAAQSKRPRNLAKAEASISADGKTVLEDFQEVIELPKVTMAMLRDRRDRDAVVIEPKVLAQLRSFIARIADMYNPNAFHNFEHASHVTASVAKLLSRIVTSDTTHQTTGANDMDTIDLAGHSYGITSDPLTQFTVVLSAVLHDVDHQGIPNAQLIKEDVAIATKYKGKSVAEQNSVDIAWTMLMEPQYAALRACIYADEVELRRFRQILVNVVMATDIADKELGALRKERWNRAFEPDVVVGADDSTDRKATIVLEHLIQASDVSHTMQHWQVYRKWNEKLFFECYDAWKAGLADQDPSLGWYKGELGFFDFYVIPLTKKLGNCGVFGVSSHEYLNYAMANRNEWEKKGKQMVEEYLESYKSRRG
eukprot:Nitzschia sp. Nitz4//scaffold32_size149145//116844//124363//NITZ4_002897-RA/size149145-snap-gene-0.11-mRNA-1//1//CDS//3329548123//60//frame0